VSYLDTGEVLLVIKAAGEVTIGRPALENSKLLGAIVEHSNDAIIAKTLDGIVTSWNPAAERMYGYTSQEILAQSIVRISREGQAGEIILVLASIKAGQPIKHFETVHVRKDGTVFPVLLTVSPIRDADGAVVGASSITRDMADARQAFEAARSMIESSLDALVAISPEGMITDANEATVKTTGIPRAELIGTAFSQCFTKPATADKIYQLVFEQGMGRGLPADDAPPGRDTDRGVVQRVGLPRHRRQSPRRVRRRPRRDRTEPSAQRDCPQSDCAGSAGRTRAVSSAYRRT
jgi:PAS domain S-box-containing protein